MAGRRRIELSRIASAARQNRAEARPPVREECLKTGDRLSAWRGHSGRRYVFKGHDAETCPAPQGHAVVASVMRGDGTATLMDVALALAPEAFEDWRRDALDSGAGEIQVHALSRPGRESEDLVADLGFDPRPRDAYGLGF